jgi:aspartyl-tRNA synthetase
MIRTHYVSDLSAELSNKSVTVAGWVHEVRELGKITFLLLRDRSGIVQVTAKKGVVPDDVISSMSLPKESVVKITGVVKENKEARSGFEIVPSEVVDLNPISWRIPFEVTGKVDADLDVRLNYRYIDLRRLETTAIFKIQSTILNSFSSYMMNHGFIQIRPPDIVAEATEGGTELFSVDYFETKAYLAQSPQLYKQLAVIGGLDKVFSIVPVFRAEKSNTSYHLNESTQMDIEIGFANSDDAVSLLSNVLVSIIKDVNEKNAPELKILQKDLQVPNVKITTYSEVVDAIAASGKEIKFGDDLSRESEALVKDLFGEAVIVRDYPTSLRAFYSMPDDNNPEITKSFDMIYRGVEISSGAQRIHLPELLIESIRKKGMNPDGFKFYIDAMRSGAPPHAGWSIGLERLTMQITGMSNIRECAMFPRDRKRLTP